MSTLLAVTGPIYALLVLGWAVTRLGLVAQQDWAAVGRVLVTVALPALMFQAVTQRPLAALLDARYVVAYALGSLACFALTWWWVTRGHRADRPKTLAAFQALGASAANSGYIGYPLVVGLLGAQQAGVVALTFMVEVFLVLPLALGCADFFATRERRKATHGGDAIASQGDSLARAVVTAALGAFKHPIVWSVAAGVAVSALGITLPGPIQSIVSGLAQAATPMALTMIGGMLVGLSWRGQWDDLVAVAVGKLVLHPLLVWAMVTLIAPRDAASATAAILFASAPMIGIFPVLAQKHGHGAFCAAALLLTTVSSFVSVNLVMVWLMAT